MTPRFVALQLAHPKGLFGRFIGLLINRHNAKMNAFAVRLLELAPSDRVLEGFGGGGDSSIPVEECKVCKRDRSITRRQGCGAWPGSLREGSIEALPFENSSFSKVCTVNSLDAGSAESYRVLAPGGRAAIGFLPKERMQHMGMPPGIVTLRTPEEIIAGLKKARFTDVRVERPELSTPWNIIVAAREE